VATANSVRAKLQTALPEFDISAGALWRHAVGTALATEWLGRTRRAVVPPESFTAALLHDVGKLVLARFLDRDLLDYLERSRREGGNSALEAEREILGVHHGELGGLICQHWDLSDNICRGVAYHHDPEAGFSTICDAVHVANLVAHFVDATEEGAERNGPLPDVERGSLDRLSLDVNSLRDLCTNVRDNLGEVLRRFGA
jgi:HD-like signal output (HDOD) protein